MMTCAWSERSKTVIVTLGLFHHLFLPREEQAMNLPFDNFDDDPKFEATALCNKDQYVIENLSGSNRKQTDKAIYAVDGMKLCCTLPNEDVSATT